MENETIRMGQIEVNFLLKAADTNGSVAMFEFKVPVGAKVPLPHFHKDYDETIYGLEGVITLTLEGKAVDLSPGESCFIPRGAVHGFQNLKRANAKALAVVTPGLLSLDYFREIAVLVNGELPMLKRSKRSWLGTGSLQSCRRIRQAGRGRGHAVLQRRASQLRGIACLVHIASPERL